MSSRNRIARQENDLSQKTPAKPAAFSSALSKGPFVPLPHLPDRVRRGKCDSRKWMERSEEHTSELQSRLHLVCRLLLEKKKKNTITQIDVKDSRPRTRA